MKGIREVKKKDGKISYDASYSAQGVRYQKRFKKFSNAKKWLEEMRQKHPRIMQRLPLENEMFIDISFSGLKNEKGRNLYIAFDKTVKSYRLVTAEQIRKRTKTKTRGSIRKRKSGTYEVLIGHNGKRYHIGTFKTYNEAQKKKEEIARQAVLGKTIKIQIKNSTGYRHISKHNKKYRFQIDKKGYEVSMNFYTLQEALDFREKYFKEKGLEMPKDYIELNFN